MEGMPSEIARTRISKWMDSTKAIDIETTWTETRIVLPIMGRYYPVTNGQVFACPHCGHFDPEWSAQEVVNYFKNHLKIDPIEITVTLSVATEGVSNG